MINRTLYNIHGIRKKTGNSCSQRPYRRDDITAADSLALQGVDQTICSIIAPVLALHLSDQTLHIIYKTFSSQCAFARTIRQGIYRGWYRGTVHA